MLPQWTEKEKKVYNWLLSKPSLTELSNCFRPKTLCNTGVTNQSEHAIFSTNQKSNQNHFPALRLFLLALPHRSNQTKRTSFFSTNRKSNQNHFPALGLFLLTLPHLSTKLRSYAGVRPAIAWKAN